MTKIFRLAAAAVFLSSALVARATQTDNHGIHAVPAPGAVTIDGDLKDWDLSGKILACYDLESLRDIYSAQVSAMYDADNLYVAIQWKDPVPMGNSHDPRYQADRGWAGDAVQMRFKTDRISHLTAWYYAAKGEPALQIEYGKSLTEPFHGGGMQLYQTDKWKLQQGVEMAYVKDADGKGYVQEMKIPWGLITLDKKYSAGDQFNLGMEFLWGESDWPVHRYADNLVEGATSREFFWTARDSWGPVILEPKGNLQLPEPAYMAAYRASQGNDTAAGVVNISYQLPNDARVSLVIDDSAGHRVRNLTAAQPRNAGPNTEKWDGLDDAGKPAPAGNYNFKAIYHDGIKANYAIAFANPGNPAWQTGDGRGGFYADHTAPQGATAAGNFVALACPMGEAGKHLIGLDLNGQRLWGLPNRAAFDGGHIALATDGQTLWVATEGKGSIIYRVNIADGTYKPWNQVTKDALGNEFKVLDLPVSDLPGLMKNPALGANLSSIAYSQGVLAVALTRENAIKLIDAENGAVKQTIKIDSPRSVTYDKDGGLIALAGGKLVRIAAGGSATPIGSEIFADGYAITTDNSGEILISVRGADQNVKVISADGKIVREIGVRGGRARNGAFNANAMLNPSQIAVDSKNRLWVAEETTNPKRSSVWDVATGQLVKDLSGATSYAGAGSLDPFDRTLGFADNTVYKLDWDTGAFKTIYSVGKRDVENDLFPPSVHNLTSRVVKRGDLTYIFTTDSGAGSPEVHCTLWDGKNWRSAAHMGTVSSKKATGAWLKYKSPLFAGHEGSVYVWADQNGDGLVQQDELTFGAPKLNGQPVSLQSYYWGQLPDVDGTIIYPVAGKQALLKFPITGTTAAGAPIYDIASAEAVNLQSPLLWGGNGEGQVIGGTDGRVYINQNPILTIERDGRVSGTYPNNNQSVHGSHTATSPRPGYVIGPSSFLGTAVVPNAGEVFCLNGNLGENNLFTSDGIYIQTLFKDTRGYFDTPAHAVRGMSMDATTAGGESFGGNFVRADDGKVYLTLGSTEARVMEITGLDSIRRLDGTFNYTANQFAQVQALLKDKASATVVAKAYTISKSNVPMKIDGNSNDWPELLNDSSQLLEIQENTAQRFARVQAKYDEKNLYLAYRVFAPRSAMKNGGQDFRLLFKTGDAVDLMLGDGGKENNLRLLFSTYGGKPIAVLNQKRATGSAASEKFSFSSPWRTIDFDRVVAAADVQIATSAIQGGYFVEVAIPWADVHVTPQSGMKLRGDVGVLFADEAGKQTTSRKYWSNKETGLVNDVPGEADLSPAAWGTFILE